MRIATIWLLFISLLFAGPAALIADQQSTDADFAAFDHELDTLRKTHHLPGLAAAVVQNGKLAWAKGYGFADYGDSVPVTTDTPFWIASVTKTFIGLLFLQLEEEGKVHLDDRLQDVPGELEFCRDLAHSGSIFGRDLHCDRPITIRDILHHASNGEPGTRFYYNPLMYSRLSRYIEHVYRHSVRDVEGRQNTMAQLVQSHILGPAGMRRTMSSQWQREKMDVFFDMTQGYGFENGVYVRRPRPERSLKGGAGIVSTVEDLARYDIALDNGGLASPAVMKKLFTPATTPDGKTLPYAFGWFVQTYRNVRLVWHSGWDEEAGFSAMYLKVPDRHLALILLGNGEGIWWNNPLDKAAIQTSPFAQAFLNRFVFRTKANQKAGSK
jgi:CubicO group peptidase (beta-lactamase class C family)